MDRLEHLTEEELVSFYRGELKADQSRRVVRHLLTGCPSCRERSAGRWQTDLAQQPLVEEDDRFNKIFERAARASLDLGQAIEKERKTASAVLGELLRHPVERQKILVANSQRFRSYGLTETLLEAAFQAGFSDPLLAIEHAEIGVEMADRVSGETYGERLVYDLRARAAGTLGNAQRIASRLVDAEASVARALELADHGTGDPIERARLLSFLASLRTDQQHFDEAISIHRRMERIYRSIGDRHMVGRTCDQAAFVLRLRGDLAESIECSRRALGDLDPERDARAVLVARQGLANSLLDLGRVDEASEHCLELRREAAALGRELDELRCEWTLGKVRHRQGRLQEAEAGFRRVRDRFVELEIPFDAALASLDLAESLFDQGKTIEMNRRLAEAIPILQGLGIHREAIAALAFLKQATELEKVTVGLIRETARFVEKSSKDPELRFRAGVLAAGV